MRALRFAFIACAALVLAACSFTRLAYMNAALAYSNATPMLTWLVGDYVDMSSGQRDWVRDRLDQAMAWHRSQELPEYRRFLEDVTTRLEGPITADDAKATYQDVRGYYHRALDRLVPDLADFLARLDDEQIAHMEGRFSDGNRKFLKESVKGTREERRERDAKKYLEHIEEFTGDLTQAQRDLVTARIAQFGEFPELQLAERRYRQEAVLALARAKPPREKMIEELRRLLVKPESWRRAEFIQKIEERNQRLFALLADLSATLTAEQRAHMRDRLHGFIRDITYLTAKSAKAAPAHATTGS